MSYTPTEWKSGDTITSAKLNKIENGIAAGGGALVVHRTTEDSTTTLDKTWQEIRDALASGTIVLISWSYEEDASTAIIESAYVENEQYNLYLVGSDYNLPDYIADTADGYPRHTPY